MTDTTDDQQLIDCPEPGCDHQLKTQAGMDNHVQDVHGPPVAVARVSFTGVTAGDQFPIDHPLVAQLPERFNLPDADPGAGDPPNDQED